VAFQKYVVTHALAQMFPGRSFHVRAALMMADKRKVADCPRVNQYFAPCTSSLRRSCR